jgi:hypothetical protein
MKDRRLGGLIYNACQTVAGLYLNTFTQHRPSTVLTPVVSNLKYSSGQKKVMDSCLELIEGWIPDALAWVEVD